jgi:hypothetical protein
VDFAVSCAWTKAQKHRKAGIYMQKFLASAMTYRQMVYDRMGQLDTKQDMKSPDFTHPVQ